MYKKTNEVLTMKLIMLGAPGSGKGTQAKFITKDRNIPQISTGDLLRSAVKANTELGREAKKYMDAGKLVPDDLVLQLLKERISQDDCANGFILDGYPRNLAQAEELRNITEIDMVINIEVDYGLLVTRITGRRTCKNCGAIYHIEYSPPNNPGICDKCSGELYQRDDDTEQTVRKRLDTYEKETKPLIDYYINKKLLHTVISDSTIEAMKLKVINLLNDYFSA